MSSLTITITGNLLSWFIMNIFVHTLITWVDWFTDTYKTPLYKLCIYNIGYVFMINIGVLCIMAILGSLA